MHLTGISVKRAVNSLKLHAKLSVYVNMYFFQQIFIYCLLYTSHCARHSSHILPKYSILKKLDYTLFITLFHIQTPK